MTDSGRQMPTVFVSYCSQDRSFAERLAEDLTNAGTQVWFDRWEIRVGDSIAERVGEAIRKHDFLAVVLSPDSVKSHWVKKELNAALMRQLADQSVAVLPVLYSDCEIPPLLSDIRYADFRSHYGIGFGELLKSIVSASERQEAIRARSRSGLELKYYNVHLGHSAVTRVEALRVDVPLECVEKVLRGEGTTMVEVFLASPEMPEYDHSRVYDHYFACYDVSCLKVSPRVDCVALTGLDGARWKVTINAANMDGPELEQLLSRVIECHNEQIRSCQAQLHLLQARPATPEPVDSRSLCRRLNKSKLAKLRNKREIKDIAKEFAGFLNDHVESGDIPSEAGGILSWVYVGIMKIVSEYEDIPIERIVNDELLSDEQSRCATYEYALVTSVDWITEVWCEEAIAHMDPEILQRAKTGFSEYGLAGLVEAAPDGNMIELFREAGLSWRDTFDIIKRLAEGA